MVIDPNNRFANMPRDVHQTVARASARLEKNRVTLTKTDLKADERRSLVALVADDQKTVNDGQVWLMWSPDDAEP